MAAKKKREAAAPPKPKKRAGRPVKKKKARTKPKVQPAAEIPDNAPMPFRAEVLPPPYRPSPPSWVPWDNSFEEAAHMTMWPQMRRNAALLATSGAVEPPVTLTASPLVTASSSIGSPAFGQNHHLDVAASASDPNALHAEMLERIEALEREFDNLREQQRHGIGHNNPPEPIELAPLSEQNLGEISEDIAVLKKQPPADPPSTEVKAAVARLMKFARVAVTYAGKQADIFIAAAMTKAGEKIIWSPFIYKLWALADIAHQWLQSLPRL